jgi:hypothetical protein
MQNPSFTKTLFKAVAIVAIGFGSLGSAETDSTEAMDSNQESREHGGLGSLGLGGHLGYFTYGMSDVNARFRDGRDADFSGGLGMGGSLKLGVTQQLAAKIGIDYLLASRESHRTIGGIDYATKVELPATLIFIGGELIFLPMGPLNIKLIGGYTIVSIYNGHEAGREGALDLGAITGSGSGFQAGLGAEFFLLPSLSLGAELGYNYAKIDGATFAGGPADPASVNTNGSVDYSGMMAKAVLTVYLLK